MELSLWQRMKRRLSLLGGSYTHPDGTIELDFEVAAGISPGDSDTVKEVKLRQHYEKGRAQKKTLGALMVGGGIFFLAERLGLSFTDSIFVAALIGLGLNQIARS